MRGLRYSINPGTIKRIPIKQPGVHGKCPAVFFLFVAHPLFFQFHHLLCIAANLRKAMNLTEGSRRTGTKCCCCVSWFLCGRKLYQIQNLLDDYITRPKTNIALGNRPGRERKLDTSIPTIHFQVLC